MTQGEEVYVELTLDARGDNRARSAYYVVEDAVPAGFVAAAGGQGVPRSAALAAAGAGGAQAPRS